ncbi:MAG: hypothetical protein KKD56_13075 [Acidobacteria bacterium]|nr:hypothetical protein [Acidobacteriota bacterium]MBU1473780.1 hypothetical protein [Acidobacteriota bacterium]
MRDFRPRRIYALRDCLHEPLAGRVIDRLPGTPLEVIDSEEEVLEEIRATKDPVGEGKRLLLLTRQRGDYVKPCPCTPNYLGCNYFIINADTNCPMDCSYCILQTYLSNPLVTIHVNSDRMREQLDAFLRANPRPLRIGTGELGDSLVLDHLTDRSRDLISYFRGKMSAFFELKTKTTNIANILNEKPDDNIIIAWSLNAPAAAQAEEKGAPSVSERIAAARDVSRHGFRVAFHFDPLLHCPGWKEGYAAVIEELLSSVESDQIAWISLGALRFPPSLKQALRERFPQSRILLEEFIQGMDGKFRYFKPLRMELFDWVVKNFRLNWKGKGKRELPLYLCMESRENWNKILGEKIKGKEDVERHLTLPLIT